MSTFWSGPGPWPLPFHTLSLGLAKLDTGSVTHGSYVTWALPPDLIAPGCLLLPQLGWHKRAFWTDPMKDASLTCRLSLAGASGAWWLWLWLHLLFCGMYPTAPLPVTPSRL